MRGEKNLASLLQCSSYNAKLLFFLRLKYISRGLGIQRRAPGAVSQKFLQA